MSRYLYLVPKDLPAAEREAALALKLAPNDVDILRNSARLEQSQGRWEEGLAQLELAHRLDPRSGTVARALQIALAALRRYPEALAIGRATLALNPANPAAIQSQAMIHLSQGDLASARAVIRDAPATLAPTVLVAYLGTYQDLFWVLEEEQQQLLLRLTPSAFDGDRGAWAGVLMQTYWLRGDKLRARAYADTARAETAEQLESVPNDAQRRLFLGLALAHLGRKAEAIREGERGLALAPLSKDQVLGAYNQYVLARLYLILGEHTRALDLLEPLLKIPYYIAPGWLRIDPAFAPLKGNPRFEKLIAQ